LCLLAVGCVVAVGSQCVLAVGSLCLLAVGCVVAVGSRCCVVLLMIMTLLLFLMLKSATFVVCVGSRLMTVSYDG